ncbi:hypothetical protein Ae201684P_019337 [Aphanomyces euteiches]|uniref:Uncharacterized protein n=1 Tax=Aphanomyces euteiches TaxID=100861 RepID=A0A6G0XER6_9STRA|nr:hypothetical protein Ae201684_005588 [Aphanomyces euteiches]KAH9078246.1 hypothetical protein Ae201684P_019337 [Aphanomyces euteiches]KAH9153271.1 hypothetical protein AeRB84_004447 [Aphanomyces euteiches]
MPRLCTIFFLPELWHVIASFQNGRQCILLPFLGIKSPSETTCQTWVLDLQSKLDPWYAEYGTACVLQLVEHLPKMKDYLFMAAVAANDVPLLKVLDELLNLMSCGRKLLNHASQYGSLEALVCLHELGHPGCGQSAMEMAAKNGHLDVIQFLHANRTEGCTVRAMDVAAEHGHLDVVKWLDGNRSEGCSNYAMDHAARNGHLQVVQWLHAREYDCSPFTMVYAITGGNLSVVQWIHENRREGCVSVGINKGTPKELVEWLIVNRSDVDPERILKDAARSKRIDLMELLMDRFGVTWRAT